MPKVKITANKGLVQETGTGLDVNVRTDFKGTTSMNGSTMVGARRRVVVLNNSEYGDDSNLYQLSGSDSGTLFVIGDVDASKTMLLPSSPATGFNITFVATGSLTSARTLTLSGSGKANATWVGNVLEDSDGSGDSESVTITAAAGVVFNAGSAQLLAAGDRVEVELVGSSAAGQYIVNGWTSQ